MFCFIRLLGETNASLSCPPHTIEFLREKQINYNIPAEQIYKIRIGEVGQHYLNNFGTHYRKLFENLIDKFIRMNPLIDYDEMFADVLNNLNYIRINQSNEEPLFESSINDVVLQKLNDFVIDNTQNKPFVLKGPVGSGKTSLLSIFASNLYIHQEALKGSLSFKRHAVLVRFIGIDQKSTLLATLLKSICEQIFYIKAHIYKLKNVEPVPNNLRDLKVYFRKCLTSEFENGKLIIILDSLNELLRNDHSFKLSWLPNYFHPSIKLIISVSSECEEIVERLSRKYTEKTTCAAELSGLSVEQAKSMMKKYFTRRNLRLDSEQLSMMLKFVERQTVVFTMHFKMLLEAVTVWKSSKLNENQMKTLSLTIHEWLIYLENKFGTKLVKHTLS